MVDKIEELCLKILEKIKLKGLADWYRKHKEGMRYLIFGGLTTVLNIVVYFILYNVLHISNALSNLIAWVVAATFAYITNRKYVFESTARSKKEVLREAIYFYGCRILTLIIDEGIMVLTVDKFGWNGIIMKIVTNIIVVIANFVFSKILIFK